MANKQKVSSERTTRLLWLAPVLYTLAMAVAWIFNPHEYGTLQNIIFMIPFLVVLSASSVVLILKSKIEFFSAKTHYPVVLWTFLLVIAYLAWSNLMALKQAFPGSFSLSDTVLLMLATTLVGIGEEFTYRGFLLRTIAKHYSLRRAVLLSSVAFGLLHSVNFLAGPSLKLTAGQVLVTTIMGYVFAIIYIKSNYNLVLMATIHAIYDLLVFNLSNINAASSSPRSTPLVFLLFVLVWFVSLFAAKKIYALT